jgi:hypothetical protein
VFNSAALTVGCLRSGCAELSEVGVDVEGRIIRLRKLWGAGKGNGEVSLQATWDQGGQGSHHTERRDSK